MRQSMLWSPALPSGAFNEGSPSLSLSLCLFLSLDKQPAHITKWTTDPCRATQITPIWSCSSRLAGSYPSQIQTWLSFPLRLSPSLVVSPAETVTALSFALHPYALIVFLFLPSPRRSCEICLCFSHRWSVFVNKQQVSEVCSLSSTGTLQKIINFQPLCQDIAKKGTLHPLF